MKCEQLEKYLVDYFEDELDRERTDELLDHVEKCDACREEFQAFQKQEEQLHQFFKAELEAIDDMENPIEEAAPAGGRTSRQTLVRWVSWAAAAVVCAAVGAGGWMVYVNMVPRGQMTLAGVRQAEGHVLALEDGAYKALKTGDTVRQDQKIKVANGGYLALSLPGGNIVEARGGTQLSLLDFPDRLVVAMDRGHVWAHLKNKPDKPFVIRTAHLSATAVGTVYSVKEGLSRSIVTVAEGSVMVESGGSQTSVEEGEAYSSLTGETEEAGWAATAWSRFTDNLTALLPEDGATTTTVQVPLLLVDRVETPGKLAEFLPADTLYLLDVRDYQGILKDFQATNYAALFQQESIRQWWAAAGGDKILDEIYTETGLLETLDMAKLIEGQVIVAVTAEGDVLLLADCGGNGAQIAQAVQALMDDSAIAEPGGVVDSKPPYNELKDHIFVVADCLVISNSAELAQDTIQRIVKGEETGFTTGDFYSKLQGDVDNPRFLMAANLGGQISSLSEELAKSPADSEEISSMFDLLGLPSLDYFIISPSFQGRGMNQAARLAFSDEGRYGALNWLGEPAPMRALDFFGPEVLAFASAITRNPSQMLMDYLLYVERTASQTTFLKLLGFLAKNEAFFDAFGGEMAIGFDKPIIPVPNVKIVIEVLDRAQFQQGLDQLVDDFIAECAKVEQFAMVETSVHKGRVIHSLVIDNVFTGLIKFSPAWTFVDDYFIAGPAAAFVRDSIDVYESGYSIANDSKRLLPLLPGGADMHFSLLVYQDLAQAVPTMIQEKITSNLDAEDAAMAPDLSFMESYSAAGIAYAYARPTCVDFYLNAPEGIDMNFGMAVPLAATWIMPRLSIGQVVGNVAEAEVALEAMRLAVEKYAAENGRLPSSLSDIANPAGHYIDRIPEDPFAAVAGNTVNLIPGPAPGQVTIYSVGPDGIDDRATVQYKLTDQYDGPGDIIVRYPETAAVTR